MNANTNSKVSRKAFGRTGRSIASATVLSLSDVALLKWAKSEMIESRASGSWKRCRKYSDAWLARIFGTSVPHVNRITNPKTAEDNARWHDVEPANPPASALWYLEIQARNLA